MIGFDLPCDLKEVESMEHIKKPIHINNRTLRRHVIHSDILSLGPIDVLDILSLSRFRAIGMGGSGNTKFLSQACLPSSIDPICQFYNNIPGI